mmetsp:Transcript_27910/g.71172  ORF Transcript_27910/g.71172 Transcript_27910/m.71172 type:complete len:269 (-) Transcript_27910:520-1326(-)
MMVHASAQTHQRPAARKHLGASGRWHVPASTSSSTTNPGTACAYSSSQFSGSNTALAMRFLLPGLSPLLCLTRSPISHPALANSRRTLYTLRLARDVHVRSAARSLYAGTRALASAMHFMLALWAAVTPCGWLSKNTQWLGGRCSCSAALSSASACVSMPSSSVTSAWKWSCRVMRSSTRRAVARSRRVTAAVGMWYVATESSHCRRPGAPAVGGCSISAAAKWSDSSCTSPRARRMSRVHPSTSMMARSGLRSFSTRCSVLSGQGSA